MNKSCVYIVFIFLGLNIQKRLAFINLLFILHYYSAYNKIFCTIVHAENARDGTKLKISYTNDMEY